MAVHTFAVNIDSLSGSMSHNYYLYEYDGQHNILPWDYNLSFGGMSMGGSSDGTSMINDAIDTPFSGTQFFDALLENDEYRAQYHAYLQQLVDEYVNGGRPSISMPDQGFDKTKMTNAAVLAGCMMLMLIALFVVKGIKRRRYGAVTRTGIKKEMTEKYYI